MTDFDNMTTQEIQYMIDGCDRIEAEVVEQTRRNAFEAFINRPNRR